MEGEISKESRREILEQIEEAYQRLTDFFEKGDISKERDMSEVISDVSVFNGPALRKIRERLGIALHDVALETKIQIRHLEDIEAENYEALPPEVYTRGFVVGYAKYLSLDTKKVADDYMKGYSTWKKGRED